MLHSLFFRWDVPLLPDTYMPSVHLSVHFCTGNPDRKSWLKCCFTSTETVGLLGTVDLLSSLLPRTSTSTFTQFLSSVTRSAVQFHGYENIATEHQARLQKRLLLMMDCLAARNADKQKSTLYHLAHRLVTQLSLRVGYRRLASLKH